MNFERNHKFRILYGSVVGLGLAVIGLSLYRVIPHHTAGIWIGLALLAALTGSLSLKIPGINGKVSAGDTTTCLSLLLLGPYAGALTAAVDALAGSIRCKSPERRFQFALYNSGNSALSVFVTGQIAMKLLGKPILYQQAAVTASSLLLPLCVLAGGYYLMNTVLVAAAVAAEKSLSFIDTWREGFMWTCANYVTGAFVAGMLAQLPDPISLAELAAVLFTCLAVYISCRGYIRTAQTVQCLREKAQGVPSGSAAA